MLEEVTVYRCYSCHMILSTLYVELLQHCILHCIFLYTITVYSCILLLYLWNVDYAVQNVILEKKKWLKE